MSLRSLAVAWGLVLVSSSSGVGAREFESALAEARAARHFLVVVLVGGDARADSVAEADGPATLAEALRPCLHVVVSADRRPSVAARFGATAFPQYIVVDGDGREVGRILGRQVPSELAERLHRIVEAATRLPREDRLLEARPDDVEALYWVGTYRWNRGDRLLALECFRRIVEIGLRGTAPPPETGAPRASRASETILADALRRIAEDELDCGAAREAEEHFRRALELGADADARREVVHGLAMSLRRQGRTAEAVRVLEAHLAAAGPSRGSALILFTLGSLHLELGDREGARRSFTECAERFPATPYGLRARRHLSRQPEAVALSLPWR